MLLKAQPSDYSFIGGIVDAKLAILRKVSDRPFLPNYLDQPFIALSTVTAEAAGDGRL